jgi:hypothetical protein
MAVEEIPGSIFSRISNEEEYFNILSSGFELYVMWKI